MTRPHPFPCTPPTDPVGLVSCGFLGLHVGGRRFVLVTCSLGAWGSQLQDDLAGVASLRGYGAELKHGASY